MHNNYKTHAEIQTVYGCAELRLADQHAWKLTYVALYLAFDLVFLAPETHKILNKKKETNEQNKHSKYFHSLLESVP